MPAFPPVGEGEPGIGVGVTIGCVEGLGPGPEGEGATFPSPHAASARTNAAIAAAARIPLPNLLYFISFAPFRYVTLMSIPYPGAAYAKGAHSEGYEKMIMGKWVSGTGEGFETVLAIRTEVFCGEFGINPKDERDAFDEISAHVLIFDEDGFPVSRAAFPRRAGLAHRPRLRQSAKPGKGFGDMALRMLLDRAAGPCRTRTSC